MIEKIIEDIDRIKSQLSKLTNDDEYEDSQDSGLSFITIEAKLRELVDVIVKLPAEDRETLKDTVEAFKEFVETKQQEAEKAVILFKEKIAASQSSKNAMKAYGSLNK